MGNIPRFVWLGDGWYPDWVEPPPPCMPGSSPALPVGVGAFVGQTVITDCVAMGED